MKLFYPMHACLSSSVFPGNAFQWKIATLLGTFMGLMGGMVGSHAQVTYPGWRVDVPVTTAATGGPQGLPGEPVPFEVSERWNGTGIFGFSDALGVAGDPNAFTINWMAPYLDFTDPFNMTERNGVTSSTIPLPFQISPRFAVNNYVLTANSFLNFDRPGGWTVLTHLDDDSEIRINGIVVLEAHGPHASDDRGASFHIPQAGAYAFDAFFYQTAFGGANFQTALNRPGDSFPLTLGDGTSTPWPVFVIPGAGGLAGGEVPIVGLNGPVNATFFRSTVPLTDYIGAERVTEDPLLQATDPEIYTVRYLNGGDDASSFSFGTRPYDLGISPYNVYPPLRNGLDDNNHVTIYRGTLVAPQTGTYTFKARTDDGFTLRFLDESNVQVVESAGFRAFEAPGEIVVYPVTTPNGNTTFTVGLTEGTHEFEALWFDGGGGSHFELSQIPGIGIPRIPVGAVPAQVVSVPAVNGVNCVTLAPENPAPPPPEVVNTTKTASGVVYTLEAAPGTRIFFGDTATPGFVSGSPLPGSGVRVRINPVQNPYFLPSPDSRPSYLQVRGGATAFAIDPFGASEPITLGP